MQSPVEFWKDLWINKYTQSNDNKTKGLRYQMAQQQQQLNKIKNLLNQIKRESSSTKRQELMVQVLEIQQELNKLI